MWSPGLPSGTIVLDMDIGAIGDRGYGASIFIDVIVATTTESVALSDPMRIIDRRMYTTMFQSLRDIVMAYNNVGGMDD